MSNLLSAYKLLHSGILALQKSEYSGVRIDVDYCEKQVKELTKEIEVLEQEVIDSDLGKAWKEMAGEKFKLNSTPQLSKLLYKEMGLTPPKVTEKGQGSADEEALEQLGIPVLESLLKSRKLKKLRDTYFAQFLREHTDGILHPSFNLHTVKTYRSSSSNPNFQNIPKHGELANRVRKCFIPSKGHQFLEIDYSGIEVRVAASLVGDPKLKQDVLEGDMHRDMAIELYRLTDFDYEDESDRKLRYGAKNGFVFPQFYGSFYKQCVPHLLKHAEGIVLKSGKTAYENLQEHGDLLLDTEGNILDDSNYYDYVRDIENEFWEKRYKVYDAWKKKHWKRYLNTGKVDYPTGFQVYGKMRKNEVLNASIQGSAFHVLLLAFIMVNKVRIKDKWKTKLIGQIHDSLIFDVRPDELKTVYETSKNIMENEVPKVFKWLTIPLEVEAEVYGIDKGWVEGKIYKGD